jgi:hypothetical protein
VTGEGQAADWTPFLAAGGLCAASAAAAVFLWRRWHPRGRLHRILFETGAALRRLKTHAWPAAGGFLFSTTLQLSLLLVHRALGVKIGMPPDLGIWLFLWPASKLVAMLPISLGGLGVREAAFLTIGTWFEIPEALSVASSLAWQGVLVAVSLAGGCVWLLLGTAARPAVARAQGPVA